MPWELIALDYDLIAWFPTGDNDNKKKKITNWEQKR